MGSFFDPELVPGKMIEPICNLQSRLQYFWSTPQWAFLKVSLVNQLLANVTSLCVLRVSGQAASSQPVASVHQAISRAIGNKGTALGSWNQVGERGCRFREPVGQKGIR